MEALLEPHVSLFYYIIVWATLGGGVDHTCSRRGADGTLASTHETGEKGFPGPL